MCWVSVGEEEEFIGFHLPRITTRAGQQDRTALGSAPATQQKQDSGNGMGKSITGGWQ